MSGTRALSENEIVMIIDKLPSQRDRTLFVLGLKTGLRISELLSIRIGDVYKFNKVIDRVKLYKNQLKGKNRSREIMLHHDAVIEIEKLIRSLDSIDPEDFLFKSKNNSNRAISRIQAHRILKDSVNKLELMGKISTHSWRKTLAERVYKHSGNNLLITQVALGHSHLISTVQYLEVDKKEVDKLIVSI